MQGHTCAEVHLCTPGLQSMFTEKVGCVEIDKFSTSLRFLHDYSIIVSNYESFMKANKKNQILI